MADRRVVVAVDLDEVLVRRHAPQTVPPVRCVPAATLDLLAGPFRGKLGSMAQREVRN